MSILKLERVSKRFGGLAACDGVSLDVERGSITGLIGPNGSGKSTLFNVISGYFKPEAGSISFNGSEIGGLSAHEIFNRGVYRTFQSPQIVPGITLLENMLLAGRSQLGEGLFHAFLKRREWHKQETQLVERAYEHLKFLSIEKHANESPSILSGGQLKLLEIGRALMSDASILLLDEPAAGVNPTLAADIFDHLERLRKEHGITIFVIEHKMDLILQRVDYVFVMNKGKLFFQGTPKEISEERSVIDVYLGV